MHQAFFLIIKARPTAGAGEVTDELIDAVDDLETRNYEEAQEGGIAAAFYGWTKQTLSPEFFEYRPLGPSLDADRKLRH